MRLWTNHPMTGGGVPVPPSPRLREKAPRPPGLARTTRASTLAASILATLAFTMLAFPALALAAPAGASASGPSENPASGLEPAAPSAWSGFDLVREAASSEEPVLFFRRTPTELESDELGPSIAVFADGRVRVERPGYMIRPGLWQGAVPPASLSALLGDLKASGFLDQTAESLRQERRARSADRILVASGDPDLTELQIRLEHYTPRGDLAAGEAPLRRSWSWTDLYGDGLLLPENEPLAAFARAQEKLITWIDFEDLTRVEGSQVPQEILP